MATDDPTARRRRIAEKGSDRLALITGARAPNAPPPPSPTEPQSHHSSIASCPPTLTRLDQLVRSDITDKNMEVKPEPVDNNVVTKSQPILRKSESTKVKPSKQPLSEPNEVTSSPNNKSPSKNLPMSDIKTYLLKTLGPNQIRSAILASQELRRKCSLLLGIIALLSYLQLPIIGNFIIRSIILFRPLLLVMTISVTIALGPLVLDATKMIGQEGSAGEGDLADQIGLLLECGMLLKTSFSSFFMDFCIYSVVVVCGMSFLQKFGL